ncbi:MAG TPA: hypothetical protein VF843_05675 [Streptosporangiaceae bacterium]
MTSNPGLSEFFVGDDPDGEVRAPVRPAVRLDAETAADGRAAVHCYGHGGPA